MATVDRSIEKLELAVNPYSNSYFGQVDISPTGTYFQACVGSIDVERDTLPDQFDNGLRIEAFRADNYTLHTYPKAPLMADKPHIAGHEIAPRLLGSNLPNDVAQTAVYTLFEKTADLPVNESLGNRKAHQRARIAQQIKAVNLLSGVPGFQNHVLEDTICFLSKTKEMLVETSPAEIQDTWTDLAKSTTPQTHLALELVASERPRTLTELGLENKELLHTRRAVARCGKLLTALQLTRDHS